MSSCRIGGAMRELGFLQLRLPGDNPVTVSVQLYHRKTGNYKLRTMKNRRIVDSAEFAEPDKAMQAFKEEVQVWLKLE